MEYINFFLILLTLMLLSVTSYENFYGCSNPNLQEQSTENGNLCCPADIIGSSGSREKKWTIKNGRCCKELLTIDEYDKLKNGKGKEKLKKKYKNDKTIKDKDNKILFYCSDLVDAI
jgi:hypothetical protein